MRGGRIGETELEVSSVVLALEEILAVGDVRGGDHFGDFAEPGWHGINLHRRGAAGQNEADVGVGLDDYHGPIHG